MNLHAIRKEINLDGGSFREMTVIPMDQCIQNCFTNRFNRIFRLIHSFSGSGINNCTHSHISLAKRNSFGKHHRQSSLNPFII